MAARVRRKGCKTVRITCDQSLPSRWPSILLYDQSVVVASWAEAPRLDDLIGQGEVVDIQCAEPLLSVAYALVKDSTVVTPAAVERLRAREELGDKLCAMDRLGARGVRVPMHRTGSTTSVDAAIDALGLPIVVKPRRGAAGDSVVIARDAVAARRALAGELKVEDALFEEYIDGVQLSYCSVFLDGAVLQEAAYERVREHHSSVGLIGSLRTLDDDALFAVGRAAVAAIGGSGLVDFDVLRDSAGLYWVIDVNLRAWHSLGGLLDAGIDFAEGYLWVIGLMCGPPPEGRAIPGVELRLSLRSGPGRTDRRWWPAVEWFVMASGRRIRAFGLRYWLSELLTHVSGGFRSRKAVSRGG
jgi:hypothetical protein